MSLRLTGYQPQYFPRLHYFARILDSDIFTISDYLQYVRHHIYEHGGERKRAPSYQVHTPIKTVMGALLLDVTVQHAGGGGLQALNEAKIEYSTPWVQKHLRSIECNYSKSARFADVFPGVRDMLAVEHKTVADLGIASILWGLRTLLEIPVSGSSSLLNEINAALPRSDFRIKRVALMSESGIKRADKSVGYDANDWIIDTCKAHDADEYHFGGTSASAYMDFERMRLANIRLVQQDWLCNTYPQRYGAFIPNLSILDLLLNVSPAEARRILCSS